MPASIRICFYHYVSSNKNYLLPSNDSSFLFFCFYSTNHIPPWLQATTEWNIVISFDNTAEVPSIPITERPDQVDHKCFNVKTESNWKMASSCLIIRADKAPGPGSLHASFSLWGLQVEALSTGKKQPIFSHTWVIVSPYGTHLD